MMEKIKHYGNALSETVTLTKLDGLLAVLVAALAGCVIGMLVSPRSIKTFGCGNGCHHYYASLDGEDEEDEDA